jgi:hypothetical protein
VELSVEAMICRLQNHHEKFRKIERYLLRVVMIQIKANIKIDNKIQQREYGWIFTSYQII